MNGSHNLLISSSSSSSSSSVASPRHVTANDAMKNIEGANIRKVLPEVVRTASERHQKGLMSHYIYQILTSGEIKLPVLMEDEMHREFPSIHLIYRPIRQMVYAILFNLHHHVFMAKQGIDKGGDYRIHFVELQWRSVDSISQLGDRLCRSKNPIFFKYF